MTVDPEDIEMIELIVTAVKSLNFEAQDEIRRRLAVSLQRWAPPQKLMGTSSCPNLGESVYVGDYPYSGLGPFGVGGAWGGNGGWSL